ncbi:hypothetical protein FE782_27660 [Paenibacillus antri]|uniref:Uncharacterized protein n=1 Tax=Paenibacillus antri TaxID=2582848 RepID=A0A5R9G8I3_9BACL|nr:PQQ-binding-like beta-propeller repeat protein [Paenibacillus antri]TLS49053.1 hypothetical protein FE782_27660 [Paenibacillus antri]
MTAPFRKMILPAATALSLSLAAPPVGAEVWYEPQLIPSGTVASSDSAFAAPLARPRWTIEYDKPTDGDEWNDDRVVATDKRPYYIQRGKLVAAEPSSGRRAWTVDGNVVSVAVEDDTAVYALSAAGALSRLSASDGGVAWRTQIDDAANGGELVVADGTVYVKYAGGLLAVDAKSGHRLWRNTDAYSYGTPIPLKGLLLFATSESGAITRDFTYGIDKATGRTLWKAEGVPLQVRSDVVYLRDTYPVGDDEAFGLKVDVVATMTGEAKGSRYFLPLPEGRDRLTGGAGRAVIAGDLVIAAAFDGSVYRTHLDAEPANAAVMAAESRSDFAGPYGGKLFFADPGGSLHSRDVLTNARVDYSGLDNPVARLDVREDGLYVGQTDGDLFAFDVHSGKALFRFETGAKHFGPFRVVGNLLLVQTEGTLYAFDLPKELQRTPGQVLTPIQRKAEAALRIDGVEQRFEPSPIMIDNRMFVPLRALFEAVGAAVEYDEATSGVNVAYADRAFTLREGAPFALVGGKQQSLSYAPLLMNAAVYVPLRDVGGLLGVEVVWHDDTRTVEIATAPTGSR